MSNNDFNAPDWNNDNDFNAPDSWGESQQSFQQAPQPPRKKKHIGLKIFLVIVVFMVIGGVYSAGKDSKSSSSASKKVSSADSKSSSSTGASKAKVKGNKKELTVGESFEKSNMKMTLDNVQYDWQVPDSGDEFADSMSKPKEGFTYVKMDVTMENTGDSDELASFADFDLYADNNPYDKEYGMDSYGVNPNGSSFSSLSAGRKASFSVFWQVPVSSASVEIEYAPSFWSNEKILIKVK